MLNYRFRFESFGIVFSRTYSVIYEYFVQRQHLCFSDLESILIEKDQNFKKLFYYLEFQRIKYKPFKDFIFPSDVFQIIILSKPDNIKDLEFLR